MELLKDDSKFQRTVKSLDASYEIPIALLSESELEIVHKCVSKAFDCECLHTCVNVDDIGDSREGKMIRDQIMSSLGVIEETLLSMHNQRHPSEVADAKVQVAHTVLCKSDGTGQVQPPHTDELTLGFTIAITNISARNISVLRLFKGDVTDNEFDRTDFVDREILPGHAVVMDGLQGHAGVILMKGTIVGSTMTRVRELNSSGDGHYYYSPLYERCIAIPVKSIATSKLQQICNFRGKSRNGYWRALTDKWTSLLVIHSL